MIPAGIINLENGRQENAVWHFEGNYIVVKTFNDEEIIRLTDKAFREVLTAYCNSNPTNDKGKATR